MRAFHPAELLPPRTTRSDTTAWRALVSGRRVLVTGAGGSIGSELCRTLADLDCASLVLFERHESSLHELLLRLDTPAAVPFLGDILDAQRLEDAFTSHRPHVVFHTAAHKHLPLAERHVGEAVKNNVTGTRLVATAAAQFGTERVVLVSTDKAVNPSSVMGATKRVAELIVRDWARRSPTAFIAVRCGNVLGSSSSVLPRFLAQLQAGRPLTVTHPDVRRFFLLVSDAAGLLIDAAALGRSGTTYLFDMGAPIRIVDMARRVIQASGLPDSTPIEIIGLRPGEKLDEELFGRDERPEPTSLAHVRAIHADAPAAPAFADALEHLEALATTGTRDALVGELRRLVPEFCPSSAVHAT